MQPQFRWGAVEYADSYQLQISDDVEFSNLVLDTLMIDTNYTMSFVLSESKVYFWRVRATNQISESSWTAAWYFTTGIKPYQPVLVLPAQNSSGIELKPKLDCENVATAESYLFELGLDPNFTNPIISYSTNESEYQVSADLSYSTDYFWRVRAENTVGIGDWSLIYKFTTTVDTGIEDDLHSETEVSIQPNPTDKEAEMLLNIKNKPNLDIALFTENGALLQNIYSGIYRNNIKIDTKHLASGMYQIVVKTKDKIRTVRMMVVN